MARRTVVREAWARRVVSHVDFALLAFSNESELADWLGVNRSQLTRYRGGQLPSGDAARRLRELADVVECILPELNDTTIPKWMRGHHAELAGASPLALVALGRTREVLDRAVVDLQQGAFA